MIWFNLKELENKLINNDISDRVAYHYLLANFLYFTLFSYSSSDTYQNDIFIYIETALLLLIIVVGIRSTFEINQKGDNHEYLKRFLSLHFVILIRLFVFLLLLLIPIATIFAIFMNEPITDEFTEDMIIFGLIVSVETLFYYLLVKSFKRVAQHKPFPYSE